MTRELAKKVINAIIDKQWEKLSSVEFEALQMAIADMEKQIPKKPNRHEEDIIGEYYSCPNCMNNELDDIFDNYCPRCGQALDWSEEDE